ncbi:hypothetical protein N7499_011126 [Penicillium canescens]|nr:hypothetical protein N7499_011126 [Penicillium canescens]KAJ6182712.1 hypothetical protein N7485_001354 [Penicillium canescens]
MFSESRGIPLWKQPSSSEESLKKRVLECRGPLGVLMIVAKSDLESYPQVCHETRLDGSLELF